MVQQNFKENLIIEILIKITHLYYKSINIFFEWIPSHCGIMGNETADLSAKQALSQPIEINNKLNYSEIKPQIQIILWINGKRDGSQTNHSYSFLNQKYDPSMTFQT